MDAQPSTSPQTSTTGKTAVVYLLWVLALLASFVCLGLILPELVLVHQFHNMRDRMQEASTPMQQELFLKMLMDYSGWLSNWRAVAGFFAGIAGVAVWVMGQKPWFFYTGILGAVAFALNLLMMIWI